ncbi:MAG: excinuclease ABC subunit UvrC [bacterium]|nr:excinuclease ABC subunit UvrC [bacterium]
MITQEQLSLLPNLPGVYLMHDAAGRVVYVGKAIDIQKRLRQHCGRKNGRYASPFVEFVESVEAILTDGEDEALLLEYNLIKRYHPEFNIKLKDDKRYPYIKITSEAFPRAYLTRTVDDDGARYFGPYPHVTQARRTLSALHEIFPIRTCKYESDRLTSVRPCLDYEMGRCCAPCGGVVTPDEYAQLCKGVEGFLRGRPEGVIDQLQRRMMECSEEMFFEKAAFYRDILTAAEQFAQQQKMLRNTVENQDFIGLGRVHEAACVAVIRRRNGRVVGTSSHFLEGATHAETPEALYAFLMQFYARNTDVPKEIYLPAAIGAKRGESLERALTQLADRPVTIKTPQRGMKHAMLQLAEKNSLHYAEREFRKLHGVKHGVAPNVIALQESLRLEVLPLRIEGYDIANTQGGEAVGAMVVFQDGRPRKSAYRRFRIKGVEQINDYAMMQEMLRRRFLHGADGGEEAKRFAEPPDLLMIDGGKGHLHAAMEALDELDIPQFPICSLAKREELIFLPGLPEPIRLDRRNEGLRLLQQVRDEAHRFGNTYHAKLRGKRIQHSSLRTVAGVGPARERDLMRRFGSLEGIAAATLEEIAEVPGVTHDLAARLKAHCAKGVE